MNSALENLFSQDYPNLQIIVSDDSSDDRTVEIARNYEQRYPDKVIVQAHGRNLGVTENVRSIVPLIRGRYVCWFAGDDVCLPGKIRKQVRALEEDVSAIMCYHDVDVFDGATGRSLYRYNEVGPGQRPTRGSSFVNS